MRLQYIIPVDLAKLLFLLPYLIPVHFFHLRLSRFGNCPHIHTYIHIFNVHIFSNAYNFWPLILLPACFALHNFNSTYLTYEKSNGVFVFYIVKRKSQIRKAKFDNPCFLLVFFSRICFLLIISIGDTILTYTAKGRI